MSLKLNEAVQLVKKHRSRSGRLLSYLGEKHALIVALDTKIGGELLEDAVARMDALLLKIINESAGDIERAEYRVLRDITTRWASKIDAYFKTLTKIGDN